jgi:hypothetical protein
VNPTDRDGSLIAADLHVTYVAPTGVPLVMKIPHIAGAVATPGLEPPLHIPTKLPSNGAVSGWLTFRLDNKLFGNTIIKGYDVILRDSRGLIEAVQPWPLREVAGEEASWKTNKPSDG